MEGQDFHYLVALIITCIVDALRQLTDWLLTDQPDDFQNWEALQNFHPGAYYLWFLFLFNNWSQFPCILKYFVG